MPTQTNFPSYRLRSSAILAMSLAVTFAATGCNHGWCPLRSNSNSSYRPIFSNPPYVQYLDSYSAPTTTPSTDGNAIKEPPYKGPTGPGASGPEPVEEPGELSPAPGARTKDNIPSPPDEQPLTLQNPSGGSTGGASEIVPKSSTKLNEPALRNPPAPADLSPRETGTLAPGINSSAAGKAGNKPTSHEGAVKRSRVRTAAYSPERIL